MKRSTERRGDRESEELLQITVPPVTKKSLRMRAAQSGQTMRVIVLHALAANGIEVPAADILDRRKPR
jgi:hypothetical protein